MKVLTGCSPYKFRALACLLLFTSGFAVADLKETEKKFNQRYVSKILTLRGFYKSDLLEYRSDGTPKFKPESGPWTVFGRIEITDFKLKKDKISISGNRILVAWPRQKDGSKAIQYYRDGRVLIEADMDPGFVDEVLANRLLTRIFISSPDRLEDLVPDHWRRYLSTERQAMSATAMPSKSSSDSTPHGSAEILTGNPSFPSGQPIVPGTVHGGRLLKRVQPEYPALAKAVKLSGDLAFRAVIGKDGSISKLWVEKPLGIGMEESAIEAISRWKYDPYVLNGEPVEVETTITVRYVLAGS